MSLITRVLSMVLALALAAGVQAQTIAKDSKLGGPASSWGSGDVGTADRCRDGDIFVLEVPNLIWTETSLRGFLFRPEVIALDQLTIRDVLQASGTDIHCERYTLILQTIRFEKRTPYWKCTAFVMGPGSGLNVNFDTGWRYADNTMLNDSFLNRVLGIPSDRPALGKRALLFSPPNTKYILRAIYVRRDNLTGRIGTPVQVQYVVQVKIPTRQDVAANVIYFSTVAAGVTQKPKLTEDVRIGLLEALSHPDRLEALIHFETIVALASIHFSVLRDAKPSGVYDARWYNGYLLDTDEEPIACLLVEMAVAALWY